MEIKWLGISQTSNPYFCDFCLLNFHYMCTISFFHPEKKKVKLLERKGKCTHFHQIHLFHPAAHLWQTSLQQRSIMVIIKLQNKQFFHIIVLLQNDKQKIKIPRTRTNGIYLQLKSSTFQSIEQSLVPIPKHMKPLLETTKVVTKWVSF